MREIILDVRNLRKVYDDGDSKVVALDDISFSLEKGESLAIVGPSGSGKTTLLELIGGLNLATSGVVIVNGKDISDYNDNEVSSFRNSTMGFVFQMMHLQDYFTALENVTLPMIAAGKPKEDSQKRAAKLLREVGLDARKSHYPKQLSGGEMQRVAVARALANSPQIIMADEPTGKLDRKNSDIVIDNLMNLGEEGTSLLVITHDEKVAERFDRVLKLENGNLV